MKTLLEILFAAALIAGVFLNWGAGWALISVGVVGFGGLFLAGAVE